MSELSQRQAMRAAAARLRTLSSENVRLSKEASQFAKLGTALEVVRSLVDRGRITDPNEALSKVAELIQLPERDIEVVKQAAQMDFPAYGELARMSDATDPELGAESAESRFISALFRA